MVHERAQTLVRPGGQHAQGGVAGSGELTADLDDARQHAVEREVGRHRHDGVQQEPQPGLLVEGSVDPGQHLPKKVLEVCALDVTHSCGCLREKIAAWVRLSSPSLASIDET